jgi:hypothetical protein
MIFVLFGFLSQQPLCSTAVLNLACEYHQSVNSKVIFFFVYRNFGDLSGVKVYLQTHWMDSSMAFWVLVTHHMKSELIIFEESQFLF